MNDNNTITEEEFADLIGLYVDDALTESLRALVERRAAGDPAAAKEIAGLCALRDEIRSAPQQRPDPWFVERALSGLLRANSQAANGNMADQRDETLTLLEL